MAKWGSGEASGACGLLIRIDIFGMAGVCAIVEDGLVGSLGSSSSPRQCGLDIAETHIRGPSLR